MKNYILSLSVLTFLFSACNSGEKQPNTESVKEVTEVTSDGNNGLVKEVIQTTAYTYLLVDKGTEEVWMAIMKTEYSVGEKLYFLDALEMRNFKSKELDRVFGKIYFVQNFSKTPVQLNTNTFQPVNEETNKKNAQKKVEVEKIEPIEGGVTIAELFENKADYNTNIVTVTGKVVKVNLGIMGKNWIHLQDGTNFEGDFDLLVTTQAEANVGDIVVFEGAVAIDQEFGGMYAYELLIEEGTLK